jgi:LytS/YehU family sensor histidine kinase
MNPHFIFNSLNSINYFISQNDRLSANRYIADFSRLIRAFLGNLSKEYIPFESELETIKDYLQLEHLRFGDKFDFKLLVAEAFEPEHMLIFPGMVQPFIENAIWHGVRGLVDRKGNITIQFLPGSSDYCICIVEDDGIGRNLSRERKNSVPGKKSNGIAIVTERLKIINQIRNTSFRLVLEDLYPDREETGTRVTIEIPLKL